MMDERDLRSVTNRLQWIASASFAVQLRTTHGRALRINTQLSIITKCAMDIGNVRYSR
jgi:hypothetical protein